MKAHGGGFVCLFVIRTWKEEEEEDDGRRSKPNQTKINQQFTCMAMEFELITPFLMVRVELNHRLFVSLFWAF